VGQALAARGQNAADAMHQALGLLYAQTLRQATYLAMMDVFFVVACICFAVIPLVFIMRRPPEHGGDPVDAH
jgi:hypothetical protein